MEFIVGKGPISLAVEWRGINEPRITPWAHFPRKLSRYDTTGPVNQTFWQNDCRGQIISAPGQVSSNRCDRRPITGHRFTGVERRWRHAAPGKHNVVTERMVIGRMRQRSYERPEMTSCGEFWQVLADFNSGCSSRNRLKFTANVVRCQRLHVKAVVLTEPA